MAAVVASSAQVSRCWHPAPGADLIQVPNGSNVAVLTGPAAYQLTTGDVIEL